MLQNFMWTYQIIRLVEMTWGHLNGVKITKHLL